MVIQGVKYPSDFEAKKAMIEVAKRLESKGYAIGGDGSISVRVGPNAIWITVAGADKGMLTQDMMVRIDMNGKQMMSAHPKQLPDDLPIHLKVYAENDKVQSVMHAYPPMVNAMTVKGQAIVCKNYSPAVRALGNVPLMDGSNKDQAAQKVALICKNEKGVLLSNDGCMFWGKDVMEGFHLVEAAEYYAKMDITLHACGMEQMPRYQSEPVIAQNEVPQVPVLKGVTPIIKPSDKKSSDFVASIVKPVVVQQPVQSIQQIQATQPVQTVMTPVQVENKENVLVKDVAKELIMQEVVRRTMMNLNK